MIELKGLTKRYEPEGKIAVDGLDLTVEDGMIFGFLGPNGAGKSTTIGMLVGSLKPTAGTVSIFGHDAGKDSLACKKLIGYVPDEPLFYEHMSGRRYIGFICDLFGIPAKERKEETARLAELFSLEEAIDTPISSYSHGMKQKLGVIAALIHHPRLLILDEPMVGLDPKSSYILKDVMRTFCKKGGTVFFSTHVMEVAQNLCTDIGIIDKGKLLFHGSFADLNQGKGGDLEQLFLQMTGESGLENKVEEALS
ncbi:MAG: ABC transporter ATP-binding protein [Spirochaetia bacterium]|nr:ABC transporter ATP-binding protein [Spirochaetia bacterium]